MVNDICRMIQEWNRRGETTFALVTVIHVEGSAYRHEGAKMMVMADGSRFGTISAGCLEEDLLGHAEEVIRTLQPKTVVYDLRTEGEAFWGQGAGCNGVVEVFIEAIERGGPSGTAESGWSAVEKWLEAGGEVVRMKPIDQPAGIGTVFFLDRDGQVKDRQAKAGQSDENESILLSRVQQFSASGRKAEIIICGESGRRLLFERFQPRETLYLFGAGPDAQPLVQLAAQLDFSVVVIDPRSRRCTPECFPDAQRLVNMNPGAFLRENQLSADSFCVVMTHNFLWDQEILQHLLDSPPYYLGVLGPRSRTQRLLGGRFDGIMPPWIHSPVGLPIGAEGPAEIGVSIMAELLQARQRLRKELPHLAQK